MIRIFARQANARCALNTHALGTLIVKWCKFRKKKKNRIQNRMSAKGLPIIKGMPQTCRKINNLYAKVRTLTANKYQINDFPFSQYIVTFCQLFCFCFLPFHPKAVRYFCIPCPLMRNKWHLLASQDIQYFYFFT